MRAVIATLIAALLLPVSAYAGDGDLQPVAATAPNRIVTGMVATFDVVILRPLGLVVMAVGAAAFVPAAFLTAPMGMEGIRNASEVFVKEPTKQVFQRPLGDF